MTTLQSFLTPVCGTDRDARIAAAAVAEGTASVRPTAVGVGLTHEEQRTVTAAVIRATNASTSEYPFAAGERASRTALRAVLAERPRIEPEPPADKYTSALEWPAWTDEIWEPIDGPCFGTIDAETVGRVFSLTGLGVEEAIERLVCFPAICGGAPSPDVTPVKVRWDDRSGVRSQPVRGYSDFDHRNNGHAV